MSTRLGDLESTSAPGMWESERAKKKNNPPGKEKKGRNKVHITGLVWIITSVRYHLAKDMQLSAEK